MPERGYAVISLKTTGLFPYPRDRIVEIAVVHLSDDGDIMGRWQSVINPHIHIDGVIDHGIGIAELLRAPSFEQIAPKLIDLLRGRVLVAHNAQFVTGFLLRELELMGYAPGRGLDAVCTMHLARSYLPGAGRLLVDCCAAYDIDIEPGPGALVQAVACASLLAAYLHGTPRAASFAEALNHAARIRWPHLAGMPSTALTATAMGGSSEAEWVERDPVVPCEPHPNFLTRMVLKLPDHTGAEEHLDYLAMLDLCLISRLMLPSNLGELHLLAEISDIGPVERAALHQRYFDDLVKVAATHGALTVSDSADLIAVSRMLDIAPEAVAQALTAPVEHKRPAVATLETVLLEQGDIVVLTGDMARARSDWARELVARGLSIGTAVTLRTRLLVAADPSSVTGKTVKANDYGIPIVSEFGLRSLIGVR